MEKDPKPTPETNTAPAPEYVPPTIAYVGTLADLTRQKDVGAADGQTFLGVDIGS